MTTKRPDLEGIEHRVTNQGHEMTPSEVTSLVQYTRGLEQRLEDVQLIFSELAGHSASASNAPPTMAETDILGHLPEVLMVEKAANILRISRNSAYDLARQWLATNGQSGIPVVRLGRSLRVPRARLSEWMMRNP